MMDKKSANGFSKASETGGQRKQLPYSVETPYGFTLDLDFLKYVDDIEKGNTIKRVHIQRKNRGPKYSTLPRNFSLPGHGARPAAKDTWANTSTLGSKPKSRVTEVQQLFEFRASDGSSSSGSGISTAGHSKVQNTGYLSSSKPADEPLVQASYKEQQLSLNVRPHLFRASSMPVNVPQRRLSDSTEEQSPQSQNGSTERLFRPVESSDRRGSVPQDRASLHQQITAALKRVRELEEQVRTIPELKSQICSLREEKEKLLQRIQEEAERKVEPSEKPQPEDSTEHPVATQQQEKASAFSENTVVDHKSKPPASAEPTVEPQTTEGQGLVAQDLAEQEAAKSAVSVQPVSTVMCVPVILIEKVESPTDSEESEKQLEEFKHEAEIPERFSEQELDKQEETQDTSVEDKQSELSEQQADTSEYTDSQGKTEKAEAAEGSGDAGNKLTSATQEQESLAIQELQVKVKTLEESLSQASCELEKTNSLLSEQIEENKLKDLTIQELSDKVMESFAASIQQETTLPPEPKPLPQLIVTCDVSVSTDSKSVSEKAVLTDAELQPDDGPKETDLISSSTQTNIIQTRDIEVLAQVMTAEKVVGVEVSTSDQAVETDVPISPTDNAQEDTSEGKADEQRDDMKHSIDKEDTVEVQISESIMIESDVAEGYVIVEKTEGELVETVAEENTAVRLSTVEYKLPESVNVERVVIETSTGDTSTGESQQGQDQKQEQGQDTQPQPQTQPQRSTETATSPAAIGQVVNRIQGLLNEQWASLGSGSQEGKGESSQKQPVSKMSSIQSHLRGSLSALSAFYSPVQKAGAAKQSGLKSIMKKNDYPDKQGNGGVKKNLKFVGVNGGYESTSSEESSGEENEDEGKEEEEVDSSEPEEQGEEKESGAAQEEEEEKEKEEEDEKEAAATGEQADEAQAKGSECSEEPKDPEASIDPQEEQPASEFVDKNFMAACHYLKDRMAEVSTPSKDMRQVLMVLYQEWFRVSSQKESQAETVTLYLREIGNQTPTLLRYIVNLADGNGNMALHYSVSHSNFPVVKLLLDTGLCEVDHQNKAGYTAIMLAALTAAEGPEDMEVAQQLLSLGNINAKASQSGQTALMLAVSHGRTAMVQVLLDCKADVNIQDQDGSTALMCASEHGHTEIAKLLLDVPECDTSLEDKAGHTALSVAIKASHSEIVDLLKAHAEKAGSSHAAGLL